MDITIEDVIKIEDPSKYKIHFAVLNEENEQPLDVFVKDREAWKDWNGWKGTRDDFSREYIFAIIRYHPQPEKWLFGGIFRVAERLKKHNVVVLEDLYKQYIGRLLIHYEGPGGRGRARYFEKHYSKLIVSQIFDKPYSGEAFCGYENIKHGFNQIESIIKQNRQDWKTALQNIKGVYLIVDKKTGKMYVGSAYGDSGIWSRWMDYVHSGHGGNKKLKKLVQLNGKRYVLENFQFSLLEYRSLKTDDQVIIDREHYWKRVLLSNKFGYNDN